ncbi:MAG: DNA polymerase beta superfamily protein [Armatimonadota bacterium]
MPQPQPAADLERFAADFDSENPFAFRESLLFCAYVGSQAHGTWIPPEEEMGTDDIDLMAVVLPPPRSVIGLREWEHWCPKKGDWDYVAYAFPKYFRLLLKANPNVLALLWERDEEVLYCHPLFARLREQRELFSSRRAAATITGYAQSQIAGLHKMKKAGYMGERRAELRERFGYDVKMASHALRLLQMGCEFLETGQLRIYRTDDAWIYKEVKQGKWPLERVEQRATELLADLERRTATSPLPEHPDLEACERLLVGTVLDFWREKGWLEAATPGA